MMIVRLFIFLSLLMIGGVWISARAHAAATDNADARCTALQSTDFSRVPDALTQIISAQLKAPEDKAPGYCEVSGYVSPGFEFLLRLPLDWNGKFIELGCGGQCGSTAYIRRCEDPLRRGYACIVSDGGHRSTMGDVKWAYNNPHGTIDYWVKSSHVTALAGKAIAQRYYAQAPHKAYFMGCSAGGIQAMREVQTFPWDFDGVIAGGPALHTSAVGLNATWALRALTSQNGERLLQPADVERVHEAVVARCDLNDGVKDGLIGDPRACHFNPAELRCTGGRRDRCLTAEQVAAVEKIYRGPVTSGGVQIVLPASLFGSERSWIEELQLGARGPNTFYDYMQDSYRYSGFEPNPGPTWKLEDFDYDRDYRRLGMREAVESVNPDLRRFETEGGKLLMFTGWSDALEGVLGTVDYYETVEKVMGSRARTQDFFRLFVIPGLGHCSGGEGAFFVDYLSALEAWVEGGQAPDSLIGSHLTKNSPDFKYAPFGRSGPLDPATVEFTRPIYPYPMWAKYRGRGNPKDATSFAPVKPDLSSVESAARE